MHSYRKEEIFDPHSPEENCDRNKVWFLSTPKSRSWFPLTPTTGIPPMDYISQNRLCYAAITSNTQTSVAERTQKSTAQLDKIQGCKSSMTAQWSTSPCSTFLSTIPCSLQQGKRALECLCQQLNTSAHKWQTSHNPKAKTTHVSMTYCNGYDKV